MASGAKGDQYASESFLVYLQTVDAVMRIGTFWRDSNYTAFASLRMQGRPPGAPCARFAVTLPEVHSKHQLITIWGCSLMPARPTPILGDKLQAEIPLLS